MEERDSLIQWSEIEPLCVLRLLVRKAWLILLAALIGSMGSSIVMNAFITRSYSSTATFVVTPRASVGNIVNTSTAYDVAEIYSDLLQSDVFSKAVHESLDGVSGSIRATQLGNTNLISVTATSPSPKDALLLIQAVTENYAELSDYVSAAAVLTILDSPSISSIQSNAFNEQRVHTLATRGCGIAMAAALIWLSISSGTIQNSTGAKNNLDAKILATIPHEKSSVRARLTKLKGGKRLRSNLNISATAISFPFVEAINGVAARFEHEHTKNKKVFLFSSVSEAEGKSTLAANTALSLAKKGLKVLFIDLDLRRPVQNQILAMDVTSEHEFGTLLSQSKSANSLFDAIVTDPDSGLSSLLSSRSYTDMIELIASPVLAEMLELARSRFDYIVIDSPPLGYFADSELLSDLSDASVLVVRQDVVPAPEINDAIDALRSGKAEFLGCILNDMRHLFPRFSSYGYYGYYGSKYYGKSGYGSKGKAK